MYYFVCFRYPSTCVPNADENEKRTMKRACMQYFFSLPSLYCLFCLQPYQSSLLQINIEDGFVSEFLYRIVNLT